MMVASNQISPGMTIELEGKVYLIESAVKVTVSQGVPFIKTKLKSLVSGRIKEKNFKLDQEIKEVALSEKRLEFLYIEGRNYLFLDIENLDHVEISSTIIGDKANYLKEGIEVKAKFYGDQVFAMELPQFLELMVMNTEISEAPMHIANATKIAILETGAKIEVPLFVEGGDIVKVDTHANEFIQRV